MQYQMSIRYNKNKNNILSQMSEKYGSDKGSIDDSSTYNSLWSYHTYTDFYSMIFGHYRDSVKNIFECGIGTNNENFKSNMTKNGTPGASLRMWEEYFQNANIFGADIDGGILFQEGRIKTYQMDQTVPESIKTVLDDIGFDFDIFIDDGLHEYDANIVLYENSVHRVRDGGIYIIEDIVDADLYRYEQYFESNGVYFESVVLSGPKTPVQNILIIIHK